MNLFLFLLFHLVQLLNAIKVFQDLSINQNLINNFCRSHYNVSSKIINIVDNTSQINYTNTCFNHIPQEKPLNGGAAHIINSSSIYIFNCTFSNNIYGSNGGAIYFESSIFNIDDCIFYKNQALNDGGAISSFNPSTFSKLRSNTLNNKITNTHFIKNMAKSKGGGVSFNDYSPINFINITFDSNRALNGASFCLFSDNIYQNSASTITFLFCQFIINLTSYQNQIYSNIDINGLHTIIFSRCHFQFYTNLNIETNKVLHLSAPQSIINFTDENYVTEANNTFTLPSSFLTNITLKYNIHKTQNLSKNIKIRSIPSIKETIISQRQEYIEIQRNVRIINSKFSRFSSTENGGALYLAFCPRVSIKSAAFDSIKTTQNGGAIFANQSQIEIFDTNFINCLSLQEGGAIFIGAQYDYLKYFNLMNCIFERNEAQLNGGAISLKNSLNLLIGKCTFNLNYAGSRGLSIYSYGFNEFIFNLISSSFYSVDYSNSTDSQSELNRFYSQSEIDLNSFQALFVQNCFFTPVLTTPSNLFSNSIEGENDQNLNGKIYLKGKEVILYITSGCCCLNTTDEKSVQMSIFNPFDQLHYNCTNHTTSTPSNSPSSGSNSTAGGNEGKNDERNLIPVVEMPGRNIFMEEIEEETIHFTNNTINDHFTLKKFTHSESVYPISSQLVTLSVDADTSYDWLFVCPLLNDSKIYIQKDIRPNIDSNNYIGFFYLNTSSEVILNRTSPLISLKGVGNATFSNLDGSENLNLNKITVSNRSPLKLSFSDDFKSVSVNLIDFFIRGSLKFESNETVVAAQKVTVHQEAVSTVNSLRLSEEMTFKANSKLEVTDRIIFDEKSAIIFEFNESVRMGNFFHHKDDHFQLNDHTRPILTIPTFSKEKSGFPSRIVVKQDGVITSFMIRLSTEYSPVSSHLNSRSFETPRINSMFTSPELNAFPSRSRSLSHHPLMISKLSSSPADSIDEGQNEGENAEGKRHENSHFIEGMVLICSDDFDFDLCNELVSPSNDRKLKKSNLIEIESEFFGCECFVNEINQTCIGLVDTRIEDNALRYVHLSTKGVVCVFLGGFAAIASLLAIIFVANGLFSVRYPDTRL